MPVCILIYLASNLLVQSKSNVSGHDSRAEFPVNAKLSVGFANDPVNCASGLAQFSLFPTSLFPDHYCSSSAMGLAGPKQ